MPIKYKQFIHLIGLACLLLSLGVPAAYAEQFTCPMHPHYISDVFGTCPICGMDLVPMPSEGASSDMQDSMASDDMRGNEMQQQAASAEKYTCPMHPHYIADEFGTCPICGMDLVPMVSETGSDSQSSPKQNAGDTKTEIRISPETIQNIGVRTAPVETAFFGRHIRSFGIITENQRLKQTITGRVAGWVESLAITAVGDRVKLGDLVLTLYSPDLVSAQQDYLAALSTNQQGRIRSSAQRLQSMGVGQQVLEQLRRTRKSIENVPFYAIADGVVNHLMVAQGSYITPGSAIATLQGYERVWVTANVAEKDLQFIEPTTKAKIIFPNLGNAERIARVDYIHPVIDENSRTGKVRLVLDNPEGMLRPGAYADIVFQTQVEDRLSIPSEAILRSAEGDYVVVAKGQGRFQSQRIRTGIHSGGRTEVLQGLDVGENIVVSSQFLIDSESSLREAFRKLQRKQKPLNELSMSRDQLAMIDHLIDAALYLHRILKEDIPIQEKQLNPALELNALLMPVFRGTQLQFVLQDAELAVRQAQVAMTRSEQKTALNALVLALKPWVLEGNPAHYQAKSLRLFRDNGSGAYWFQLAEEVQNPFGTDAVEEVLIRDNTDAAPASMDLSDAPKGGAGHAH